MVERAGIEGREHSRKVLVIDDDQDLADSLSNLLALEGYEVATAYSASVAATVLSDFRAEVALIDIRLGEGSGIELIPAFRQRYPDIVCVMMTAYASAETAIEALQHGAYDYLCKPFFTEDLLATLERCFERLTLARGRDAVEATLRRRNQELEQAVESLRWSEERLRRITENSPSAISLRDLDGRFLIVNKQFEAWHGVDGDAVARQATREMLPPDLARLYREQDRDVLLAERAVHREIEMPFGDGTVHSVLMTTFPVLDGAGAPMGAGTIGTDVSAHKRAQEQLRQAQKMEALGQLTGGVAHDFNNLLAVILGNLELIQEGLQADSEMREMVEDALESACSGVELTHRLLAFGRRQTLHPQPTDVRRLISDMSRLLERTLGEIIKVVKILPDQLWNIEVDRNQVETSLLNLAINARDAMPDGGTLTIEAANFESREAQAGKHDILPPGRYVMIAVRDTGVGMPPTVVESAFQPFFTTKDVGQGSGLGLSMVYGFVKQSGGSVEIASEPGQGSVVRLYLPRASAEPVDAPAAVLYHARGKGETILVVEDRPDVRKLASKILVRLGYRVVEASDGPSALTVLQEQPGVDLMLADIVLPGRLNGLALAKEASARHPNLRILYTSGYAPSIALQGNLAEPGARLIKKPFHKDELAEVVRSTLDGSIERPAAPTLRA